MWRAIDKPMAPRPMMPVFLSWSLSIKLSSLRIASFRAGPCRNRGAVLAPQFMCVELLTCGRCRFRPLRYGFAPQVLPTAAWAIERRIDVGEGEHGAELQIRAAIEADRRQRPFGIAEGTEQDVP